MNDPFSDFDRLDAEMDEHNLRSVLRNARYLYTSLRMGLVIRHHANTQGFLLDPEMQAQRKEMFRWLKETEASVAMIEQEMRARGFAIPNPRWGKRDTVLKMSSIGEFTPTEEETR